MTRWRQLAETSPSGCALFRCPSCGTTTKRPMPTCAAGCYDGPVVERWGWLRQEIRLSLDRVRLVVVPWGGEPRVEEAGVGWWDALRSRP